MINSIPKKYCCNTHEEILDYIDLCRDCGELPIPCYRTTKDKKNSYCKNCYYKRNFDDESLIELSKIEKSIVHKLKIRCKHYERGCKEIFRINIYKELLDHQKKCSFSESFGFNLKENLILIHENKLKCKKCDYYHSDNLDCFKSIKISNQETCSILEKIDKSLINQEEKYMRMFKLINEKIETYQAYQYENNKELKKYLEKSEKIEETIKNKNDSTIPLLNEIKKKLTLTEEKLFRNEETITNITQKYNQILIQWEEYFKKINLIDDKTCKLEKEIFKINNYFGKTDQNLNEIIENLKNYNKSINDKILTNFQSDTLFIKDKMNEKTINDDKNFNTLKQTLVKLCESFDSSFKILKYLENSFISNQSKEECDSKNIRSNSIKFNDNYKQASLIKVNSSLLYSSVSSNHGKIIFGNSKIFYFRGYNSSIVEVYLNKEDFSIGKYFKQIILPYKISGTYPVIINDILFYVKYGNTPTNNLIKFNLEKGIIEKEMNIDQALIGNMHNQWGGYNDIILITEKGKLYAIYATNENNNSITVSLLDTTDLRIIKTWKSDSLPKQKCGPIFIIDSIVYHLNGYSISPGLVTYSYNLITESSKNLDINMENKGGYDTSLYYDEVLKSLITQNGSNIYIYKVDLSKN
jgi:hypothetical protein